MRVEQRTILRLCGRVRERGDAGITEAGEGEVADLFSCHLRRGQITKSGWQTFPGLPAGCGNLEDFVAGDLDDFLLFHTHGSEAGHGTDLKGV